jgi:hypothetical protein
VGGVAAMPNQLLQQTAAPDAAPSCYGSAGPPLLSGVVRHPGSSSSMLRLTILGALTVSFAAVGVGCGPNAGSSTDVEPKGYKPAPQTSSPSRPDAEALSVLLG